MYDAQPNTLDRAAALSVVGQDTPEPQATIPAAATRRRRPIDGCGRCSPGRGSELSR